MGNLTLGNCQIAATLFDEFRKTRLRGSAGHFAYVAGVANQEINFGGMTRKRIGTTSTTKSKKQNAPPDHIRGAFLFNRRSRYRRPLTLIAEPSAPRC